MPSAYQTIKQITWALMVGYGTRTTIEALRARQQQLQGLPAGDIAGVAAAAWFLANSGFQSELETLIFRSPTGATGWNQVPVMAAVIAMIPSLLASWARLDSFFHLKHNYMGSDEMP